MSAFLPDPLQPTDGTWVLERGRKLIYFGGCDYFRLSQHPQVLRALTSGLKRYGLNVAASRTTTGNHRLYHDLETELAAFFGAERAVLLPNGYSTNIAVAQGLRGQFAAILIDAQ